MGFKERPPCVIEGCGKPSMIFMFNKFFCGECVTRWHKRQTEEQVKNMQEALK